MNRSTGYMLALCVGVSGGWLAQQFWFAGLDQHVSKSERDLLRNEKRMQDLNARQLNKIVTIEVQQAAPALETLEESPDLDVLSDSLSNRGQLLKSDFRLALDVATDKLSQNDVSGALLFLYDLRPQVDYQDEADYLSLVHSFVEDLDKQLEESGEPSELVSVYRQLISLEPDHVPYHLSLTQWLIVSRSWGEAEQSLIPAKFDIRYREEVELLENMIAELRDRADQYVVPLQTVGEHYLVQLLVDDVHSLSLMLDTGATMTVMRSSFVLDNFPSLMDGAEELRLKTANGVVEGSKVEVPSLSLSGLTLTNVAVGVLPLEDFSYDGLLGMDILKRFEFNIDQESQQLILKP